jgi:anti-sigma factor RsiW
MRLTPDFETTLRRYVLGDLDEALRLELEELLLTDPDAFEALGVIEDELVEEYLDGAGPAPERRKLEERFLTSPEHRRRVRLARALRDRANPDLPARAEALPARADGIRPAGWRPAWIETLVAWVEPARWQPAWVAVAAVLAVSLAGNAWLLSRQPPQGLARTPAPSTEEVAPPGPERDLAALNRDLQAKLDLEQQDRAAAEARAKALETQLGRPRTSVATFALAAGLLRAQGSLPRIAVPPGAEVVRLRLELPDEGYPLYRAALHDPDGAEIWAVSRLRAVGRPGQSAVVVTVPSELLPRGDYQVKLAGLRDGAGPEILATYPFRVATP